MSDRREGNISSAVEAVYLIIATELVVKITDVN